MTVTSENSRRSAAEDEAAWSTMRADRRFLWFWLTVATTLSVGGNVGHAWLTVLSGATRWMAISWAVAPPALLMLAIHGLPTLARMLDRDERDTLLTAVVWGVTVGAFVWSAYGIFGFTTAMGVPAEMSWVAPFVIDLSVFGATRGLVLTAPLAARMKAGFAPIQIDTSAPAPAVTAAAQKAPAIPPANTKPLRSSAAHRAVPPARNSRRSQATGGEMATMVSTGATDTLALAEHIVASGAVRKPVDTVAAILCAAAGETRKAAIAEHIGVHHSVVTKTLAAAESHSRRQLSAVG